MNKFLKNFILVLSLYLIVFRGIKFIINDNKSYYITNFKTDLYIEENGDVTHKNVISYSFDGNYKGIYRTVYFHKNKKNTGVSSDSNIYNADGIVEDSIEIGTMDFDDKREPYVESNTGKPGTYKVIEEKGGYTYKVYLYPPVEWEDVYFDYKLDNMVVTHNDVSELYTGLFEDNSIVKEANLRIHFPSKIYNTQIFCHTNANYDINKYDNIYNIYFKNGIEKYEDFNMRLVTDKNIINSDRKTDFTALPLILKAEENLKAKLSRYVNVENLMGKLRVCMIIFMAISILRYLKIFDKYEREIKLNKKGMPTMEIPNKNRNPFEIKMIETCGQTEEDTQVVLAGLFYLINKGYLKLNVNKILNKRGKEEYDYELEILKECTKEKSYMKSLVDLFFGEKTKINLKERLKEFKKNPSDYEKVISIWEEALELYKKECENISRHKGEKDNYFAKMSRKIIMWTATFALIFSPVLMNARSVLGLIGSMPRVILLSLILCFHSWSLQTLICRGHKQNENNILFCFLTAINVAMTIVLSLIFKDKTQYMGAEIYISMLALYPVIGTIFNSLSKTVRQNDEIVIERAKWKNLKAYIKKYSYLEDKELAHIITWEEYMTYGIIFGLADKVKKEIDIAHKTEGDTLMIHHYMNCNMTMNRSLALSQSSYTASTSSGGGFSGGGGCGGGGGAF